MCFVKAKTRIFRTTPLPCDKHCAIDYTIDPRFIINSRTNHGDLCVQELVYSTVFQFTDPRLNNNCWLVFESKKVFYFIFIFLLELLLLRRCEI